MQIYVLNVCIMLTQARMRVGVWGEVEEGDIGVSWVVADYNETMGSFFKDQRWGHMPHPLVPTTLNMHYSVICVICTCTS